MAPTKKTLKQMAARADGANLKASLYTDCSFSFVENLGIPISALQNIKNKPREGISYWKYSQQVKHLSKQMEVIPSTY